MQFLITINTVSNGWHMLRLQKRIPFLHILLVKEHCMRGSRKFCQSGSNFDNVFFCFVLVDEERENKRAIIGPPAKRILNGDSLAGR